MDACDRRQDLGGIDGLEIPVKAGLPQFAAHDAGQGTAGGLPDRGHADAGGIQLGSRAHGGEQRDAGGAGAQDEVDLVGDAVDAVQHVIESAQGERVRRFGIIDLLHGDQGALRVEVGKPRGEFGGLGPAHVAAGGLELPVHVGDADHVVVDQGEVAHTRTHQRLGSPAADPAQAENGDSAALEDFQGRRAGQ